MASTIDLMFDIDQIIYYIADCNTNNTRTPIITVLQDTVTGINIQVRSSGTQVLYQVYRESVVMSVKEIDAFDTLESATNELASRLLANPQ